MAEWVVHHGDCLPLLRAMPDASVDLVLADPPYFRVKDEPWDRQWDDAAGFLSWLGTIADEWRRVLKPNGSVFVFASPQLASEVERVIAGRFVVLNSIRWYKDAGWHNKADRDSLRAFLTPWEGVIFAEQRGDQYGNAARSLHKAVYAPIGRVVAEKREAAGLARHEIDSACSPSRKPTGLCYRWEAGDCLPTKEQYITLCRTCGDRREYEALRREYEALRRPFALPVKGPSHDLWTFTPVAPYPGKHVCEKPVALLEHAIEAATLPGAVVLDSFCGSGSTGVAAVRLGRRFIGMEASQRWAAVAMNRIADSVPLWRAGDGVGVVG